MPLVAVTAANPTRNDAPSLVLNHSATDPLHFICAVRNVSHSGSQEFEDVETACNPGGEAPGATTESLDVEMLWSHATAGTWNTLKPLQGTRIPFAYQLVGGVTVGPTNPEMSGFLWVPFVPFLDAAVQKYSYIPMSFRLSGIPIYTTTAPAVYAAHTGTS